MAILGAVIAFLKENGYSETVKLVNCSKISFFKDSVIALNLVWHSEYFVRGKAKRGTFALAIVLWIESIITLPLSHMMR